MKRNNFSAQVLPLYLELVQLRKEFIGLDLWFQSEFCSIQEKDKKLIKSAFVYSDLYYGSFFSLKEGGIQIKGVIKICENAIKLLKISRGEHDLWVKLFLLELIRKSKKNILTVQKLYMLTGRAL